MYGNSVPNPALIAAEIMGMMKDNTTGEVLIPGFYDDVRDISSEERTILESIRRSDDELMKEAGVSLLQSLKGENPSLASKVLPSLDINGMVSGYTGEGPKTIIPKSATVKFSCRLVEQQNPKRIRELVANFIESSIADNVDYRLDILSEDNPFYTNIEETEVKRAAAILEKEFSKPVIFNRSGGSIPAAEVLQRFFHKPVILTGFTLPDDNIHSPNENMDVELFWKGIEVLKKLYS
jgi:acetylornithine deacetylase/succinyl-diaminopimelate desuccinylase-like protein